MPTTCSGGSSFNWRRRWPLSRVTSLFFSFTRERNCDALQPWASLGSQSEVNTWPEFHFWGLSSGDKKLQYALICWSLPMLMEVLMTDPILRGMTKPHFRHFPWFQLCFHVVARNLHIIHPLSATWYPGKSAAGVNFTLNGCRPWMSKRWNLGESGCLEFPDHTCMNMWW